MTALGFHERGKQFHATNITLLVENARVAAASFVIVRNRPHAMSSASFLRTETVPNIGNLEMFAPREGLTKMLATFATAMDELAKIQGLNSLSDVTCNALSPWV